MSFPREIAGYRILAKIGEGAASDLYAAQDPKTKQVRALKHVKRKSERDDRFIEQSVQEYVVGSKLDHPHIRGVHQLIKHRKMFKLHAVTLVMELVDAEALDAHLEKRLPQDQTGTVRVFAEIADGLAHMHSRGFVHADMKPSNILIDEKDDIKIIDLGQACAVGTVKKRIQGTPGYMAPEQAHRQAITPQTDIYNFGATMYWVLCKDVIPTALPPKTDNESLYSGALDAEQVEPPVPPIERNPDVHPLLNQLILDCVELHPDDRPASMELVCNRLKLICELLENPEVKAPPLVGDEDTMF